MTDLKAILMPTLPKVVLAVVLFVVVSAVSDAMTIVADADLFGFPLTAAVAGSFCLVDDPTCGQWQIQFFELIADLLIWYAIACALLFLARGKSR